MQIFSSRRIYCITTNHLGDTFGTLVCMLKDWLVSFTSPIEGRTALGPAFCCLNLGALGPLSEDSHPISDTLCRKSCSAASHSFSGREPDNCTNGYQTMWLSRSSRAHVHAPGKPQRTRIAHESLATAALYLFSRRSRADRMRHQAARAHFGMCRYGRMICSKRSASTFRKSSLLKVPTAKTVRGN